MPCPESPPPSVDLRRRHSEEKIKQQMGEESAKAAHASVTGDKDAMAKDDKRMMQQRTSISKMVSLTGDEDAVRK